ncbi:MAG TPA: hypothetical protein VFC14_08380 [Burkholderiales bacterium]|jgi:hypothetical protein|nr:hypothetical protein [Burkholderiales bacterium]
MATFLHYLPYILGAAIAVLILVCLMGGSGERRSVEPWRPKQRHRRKSGGFPHTGRTPVKPA